MLAAFEAAACEAARAGGRILRERFRAERPLRVELKGHHDFVTEVDREAEAAVVGCLLGHFPDHEVMAEEGTPRAERRAFRWVVDPLDGTTNFIHGVPVFAVSVAVEDDRGLAAGAILDPLRDEMFHARRGGGAFLNGEPTRCSTIPDLHAGLVATGFPFRELSRLGAYLRSFEAFARSTAGIRRAGSACLDLAYTACGRYDGFWEVGLSRWDIAAGALIVREAGGTVTDVLGGDHFLESGDVVAAGARLHPCLLEITRAAFG
jgi:myo-inositol-1(or 4)-monophosphatase